MYATVITQVVIYGQHLGACIDPWDPWDPSNTFAEADSGFHVQPKKNRAILHAVLCLPP